jgi:hypothetical protein
MNTEYVPFGDDKNRLPLTDVEIEDWYKQKQTESGNVADAGNQNKFERVNDFANCKQTKSLPIQKGAGLQHWFVGGFLESATRLKILRYVQMQVVDFLDRDRELEIAKAIVELLDAATLPDTTEFFIDTDATLKTLKVDIAKKRPRFVLASLIAGVLYYIVKECPDNTVGNEAIKAWGDNPLSGSSVSRMIAVVDPDFGSGNEEDNSQEKQRGTYVDNRGATIGTQKNVTIETVNGNISL